MDETMQIRAQSFGARAEEYQRTRPSYPVALLDEVLSPAWTVVSDVGAGTGKLTALLCARGLKVTAVEPDPEMRAVLSDAAPTATVVEGTGEAIPLPDASVDAVTFAQAWHWVDHARGFVEAARVLRPGGALILIWNVRGDDAWVEAVNSLCDAGASSDDFAKVPSHPLFHEAERAVVPWTETITKAGLVSRASTWSGVSTLPPAERAARLDALAGLLDTHAETAGLDPLTMQHVTLAFSFRVRP